MPNVIEESVKRQKTLEKESSAILKHQEKSGGYPKPAVEPQNFPNAANKGIKKGSNAVRSNSEVPITSLQERLLGKVGPGTYQLPD